MKYCIVSIMIICSSILWVSCTDRALETSLKLSGENRAELERVLLHYKDNPEKKKAAEFLIRNMKWCHAEDSPFMDIYYKQVDSLQANDSIYAEEMIAFYDSIYKPERFQNMTVNFDLCTMKADYLIDHIDRAFQAWQSPWAKALSLDEFCEYILPHRLGNEPLEPWMVMYQKTFKSVADTMYNRKVDELYEVISWMVVGHRYYTPSYVPDLRPSSLLGIKVGACPAYTALGRYIYRSIGVPVVSDFTPNWANHAMGHEWISIMADGKCYPIMPGSPCRFGNHIKGGSYRISKAYRNTYGDQGGLIKDEEDIPPFFKNRRIIDVTNQYIETTDVELADCFDTETNTHYAYLSVFDLRDWKVVAYGAKKGAGYVFKDMARNAVYLPVFYSKGNYTPAYYPVKVDEKGIVSYLNPDVKHKRRVVLTRKFMDMNPKKWIKAIIGGYFVLSREAAFADADTIHIDLLKECNYQTVTLNKAYRYMKYVPPIKTEGNMAEIELYDEKGQKLTGKVIGNYRPERMDAMETMKRAFDGNVLSSPKTVKTQNDAWVGLDLGRVVSISKLVYLPRNDDNFIKEGELYELFYWDREWKSLGRQVGSRQLQYLEYDNVPDNALLLLRNLTKGKEERIFTYEDGKQVWW